MGNRLLLLPKAQRDLENIFSYIAIQLMNPEAASNLIEKIEDKFNELLTYPFSCPKIENRIDTHFDLRKCIVDRYIIVYFVREQLIEIVRVIHSRTDYYDSL
jgi:toxin ParE1/3/4